MKIIGIGIIAFFLVVIQMMLYKKYWAKNLHVSVTFRQNAIYEGAEGELVEVIENRKRLPLPMLKVKFQTSKNLWFGDEKGSKTTDQYYRNDIFQVGGGEKITRTLHFVGKKRGYYRINNIDLVASDLFFLNEDSQSLAMQEYMYVYPSIYQKEDFRLSLQKLNGEIIVKRHMLEDPFEYRGIREYQPFDDIRSVNWKATARTGKLKVNQKNYTAMQTIRIFLNLDDESIWKKYNEMEKCMQMAMGIASFFLSQGIRVSCYVNSKDILTDEPVEIQGLSGIAQLEVLGKSLARVDVSKSAHGFVQLYRDKILSDADSFFTFFISPNAYEDFKELLENCDSKGMDYHWYHVE